MRAHGFNARSGLRRVDGRDQCSGSFKPRISECNGDHRDDSVGTTQRGGNGRQYLGHRVVDSRFGERNADFGICGLNEFRVTVWCHGTWGWHDPIAELRAHQSHQWPELQRERGCNQWCGELIAEHVSLGDPGNDSGFASEFVARSSRFECDGELDAAKLKRWSGGHVISRERVPGWEDVQLQRSN